MRHRQMARGGAKRVDAVKAGLVAFRIWFGRAHVFCGNNYVEETAESTHVEHMIDLDVIAHAYNAERKLSCSFLDKVLDAGKQRQFFGYGLAPHLDLIFDERKRLIWCGRLS